MISPFQAGIKILSLSKVLLLLRNSFNFFVVTPTLSSLVFDSDFAGSNASRKSIELADSMEFDIKVLILGEKYKDPDEAVRNDLEFFKTQLDQTTVSIWDFIINPN